MFIFDSFLCQQLETLLPARTPTDIPQGDDVEEVHMIDFHTTKSAHEQQHGQRRSAYDDGDSDDEGAQPGTQACQAQ